MSEHKLASIHFAIIACIVLLVVSSIIASPFYVYGTADTVSITITGKERGNGRDSSYLVYAEDETFECTDSLLRLKFNSSDVYGSLEVGKTYIASVYGWRVPMLSWYRNIVSVR